MTRYYFDLRDGDHIFPDEEGAEFVTFDKVQDEAAKSLADMARDAVRARHGTLRRMAIEVRDDDGPVLSARLTLELERQR